MKSILIINGPNLNLLGTREPGIYGSETFEAYFEKLKSIFPDLSLHYFQSNVEGELINKIQEAQRFANGIVINPGGYSHTSVAIADAIAAINIPTVEVHLSNVHAREDFRKQLITATKCKGVISGLGLDGYQFAIEFLLDN